MACNCVCFRVVEYAEGEDAQKVTLTKTVSMPSAPFPGLTIVLNDDSFVVGDVYFDVPQGVYCADEASREGGETADGAGLVKRWIKMGWAMMGGA
jgi:hypothetical protein